MAKTLIRKSGQLASTRQASERLPQPSPTSFHLSFQLF